MKKPPIVLAAAAVLAFCTGCSDSSTTEAPPKPPSPSAIQGKISQHYVCDATVWADRITRNGVGDFTINDEESATQTSSAAQGTFILPATPAYDHVLASWGGIDTLLGTPALPMLAPRGAVTVTPLTTLAAFEPDLKTTLGGPGLYDADIAADDGVNPDLLKIAKTAEILSKTKENPTDQLSLLMAVAAGLKTAPNLAAAAQKSLLLPLADTLVSAENRSTVKTKIETFLDTIDLLTLAGKVREEAVVRKAEPFMAQITAVRLDQEKAFPGQDMRFAESAATGFQDLGIQMGFSPDLADRNWKEAVIVVEAYTADGKKGFQTRISGLDIQLLKADGGQLAITAPHSFTLYRRSLIISEDGHSSWGSESTSILPAANLQALLSVLDHTVQLKASRIFEAGFFTKGAYTLRLSFWKAAELSAPEKVSLTIL